jgi:phosphoesterase RecJ-like protein
MTRSQARIIDVLKKEDNFLVTAHVNPDGDALGSMAALGFILGKLDKHFKLYNESGVPDKFAWLKLPDRLYTEPPEERFDWIIVLDSGDAKRPGDKLAPWLEKHRIINIDHHLGNPEFGDINWVEPGRSSVGEMIGLIAEETGVGLTDELAEAVYLAMASDTGFFTYDNTTAEGLEMTARLLRNGLDVAEINTRIKNQWSLEKLHLHGRVLSRAELCCSGKVGLISISADDFARTGTSIEDCEGLVNYLRNVSGVEIALSIREEDGDKIKFSLRSSGDTDVQAIASALGGGGHKNASGGTLDMDMARARDTLINTIRENLTGQE